MPSGIPPYGNVSTEDLAHMFSEMEIKTGIELRALLDAGRRVQELLGLELSFSHALQGGTKEDVLEQGRVSPRDR